MIRTRIAPSPTGDDIHIGNLYTALINWAWAKKHNGRFVVRIEDTDRTRYVEGAEQKILESLASYGLKNDEGPDVGGPYAPYRQSERLELYKRHALELVEKGKAYFSFATKSELDDLKKRADTKLIYRQLLRDESRAAFTIEDANTRIAAMGEGAEYTIRLLVPANVNITFHDLIRGDITISTDQIDDQVLLKSDGFPTYHLAVVVDDVAMRISHVIRAEEWIASTPKHVMLYDAFGWEKPVFCHVPILRNPDKSKLSKRKNPVWAGWYLENGYLPEAMLNYLSLMGWSHPDQIEVFDLAEFVKQFELNDLSAVGPVFDPKKLEWMNGMWIRKIRPDDLAQRLVKFYKGRYDIEFVRKTVPLVQERMRTLMEYAPYVEFFFTAPTSIPTEFELDIAGFADILQKVAVRLEAIPEDMWKAEKIGEEMQALCADLEMKPGKFFQMLRVVITGKKVSPPLNESMELLGKKECVQRVSRRK
ncbi:MAG: glutamate--tRNA ligase [Patescibacteria group bacterium]|nr:glutamate--tRNA ligase [Patescibacteria group bacterium]